MRHADAQKGFIALITTIILSLVILTLVVAVGFSTFFGRFAILDSEVSERSSALADACIETAILRLAQNEDYDGEDPVDVNGAECYICEIEDSGSNRIIRVQAQSLDAFTNLEVEVIPATGEIVSWEELPTIEISGGTCDIP